MRQIEIGKINDLHDNLEIFADEPDKKSGASHKYTIRTKAGENEETMVLGQINFQDRPMKMAGVNGVSNEVLLLIVRDRLRGFQNSEFACAENQEAINGIEQALSILNLRTQRRIDRGVEGTYDK